MALLGNFDADFQPNKIDAGNLNHMCGACITQHAWQASTITTTMPSSAFGASSQQSSQINNQDNIVQLDRLFAAHVSKDALRNYFHSPPEGHPNTRTTVHNEIGGWMDESESKKSPLLWLNGPAAVVNSVIAKIISGYQDQIVATFFFSTSSDRSAATLFTTLAWQLARRIPDTRKHIIASLKNSGSLRTSHVEKQFDSLIIQPLKKPKHATTVPASFSTGKLGWRYAEASYKKSGSCTDQYGLVWIQGSFLPKRPTSPPQFTFTRWFQLSKSASPKNVKKILRDTLQTNSTQFANQPCDISEFADASCGHFLYASTIVRLLDDPYTDSRDVLKMARCGSLPTPDLNELYKNILKRAQDTAKEGGADYRTEWGFVMDSLALLIFLAGNEHFFTVRKSFPFIETLLGLESGKLTLKLSKMHSVLRIVPGESIEVHHRSFLEFLQSKEWAGEYYTAYSTAMQRTLNLIGRAMIKLLYPISSPVPISPARFTANSSAFCVAIHFGYHRGRLNRVLIKMWTKVLSTGFSFGTFGAESLPVLASAIIVTVRKR
ncbi:hypothetical protein JOM56_011486 [Amanita muscaria]